MAEKALFMVILRRKCRVLKRRNHKAGYVTSSNCTLDSLSTFIVNNKQQKKQLTKNKKKDGKHISYAYHTKKKYREGQAEKHIGRIEYLSSTMQQSLKTCK